MLYFCPRGFQIPYNKKIYIYINITEQKMAIPKTSQHNLFEFVFPPLSFSPLRHLFHPSYPSFPSSLSISRRSLPSFFLISSHPLHMCSIVSLSLGHILHLLSSLSVQYLFSLSLFVPASESRHHFPFFRTLSPQVHRNILCHASLDSLILSLLSCLSVSLSLSLSSAHIHLPSALNLSNSSLAYPFLL
jgi:hypothetical protein